MKKGTIILIVLMSFCWTLQGQHYTVESGSKDGRWNILKFGRKQCAFDCDSIVSTRWGYFSVKNGEDWAIIDSDCEMIHPYEKRHIQAISKDHFKIANGEKYGVIDTLGDTVLDYIYEDIDSYSDTLSLVKVDSTWTYIDQDRKAIEKERLYFKNWDVGPRYELCGKDDRGKTDQHCSDQKLITNLYRNLIYPKQAHNNRTQGTVVIQFDISPEGKILNPIIKREIGDGCGEAALKVVKEMHDFIPAEAYGQKIWCKYTLPVKFKLESR